MNCNFFVTILIITCSLLTIPVFLSGPAAAEPANISTVMITGKIPLVAYDITVTNIGPRYGTVTWKTNGNADSRVDYGTTPRYRSNRTNESATKDHTVALTNLLPNTRYHYRVVSADALGNRAISPDATFTTDPVVPPIPTPTPTPTVTTTTDTEDDDDDDGRRPVQPLPPYEPEPQSTPDNMGPAFSGQLPGELAGPIFSADNPWVAEPVIVGEYPIGFNGLLYNATDDQTLFVNLSGAKAAGADVSMYSDRIEVYQHGIHGMLIIFWGDHLTINNGIINGTVTRAEFETDPEYATLSLGNISGSVHAIPIRILVPSFLRITITNSADPQIVGRIRNVTIQNGLELENIAYMMDVERVNLPPTGPADVTMTLPPSWVEHQWGTESIHIARINNETGHTELLNTEFGGTDTDGNLIFRGDSPYGCSLFVIFSARPGAVKQGDFIENIPFNFSAIGAVLIIVIAALVAVALYFRQPRKKNKGRKPS